MAVTSTPTISKTASNIKADYPGVKFKLGSNFYWSSKTNTVTHAPLIKPSDLWLLLHELAHAELKHTSYKHDVELVKYEVSAWQLAKTLALRYQTQIDEDFIEDSLDTYRLWLHQRSLCPQCMQTGLQQNQNTYSCLNCRCSWRVNDARLCGFRRKTLSNGFATAAN